jgi:murein DD-endopeptidase MepM/ murein hydrolase activator NlpD
MNGAIKNLVVFILLSLLVFSFAAAQSTNQNNSVEELRSLIDEKNEELQEILRQREVLEKELEETNKQSTALQREINTINHNINQLNLSIKANRLILEKLELEISAIESDIGRAENNIGKIKETIVKLFVELQQRDNENLLIILFRNQSLAGSVSEAQTIANLNNGLASEVNKLTATKTNLSVQLEDLTRKKQERQIEKLNLTNRQAILTEQQSGKQQFLTLTKNQEQIYQQQIAELDKKQEEISAVIEKIEQELRASFDPSLLPLKRPGVLAFPVERPFITQEYGPTAFAQYAYRTKFHNGVDFRAPLGTPIFAALDGIVKWSDNNDRGTSRWTKYQYGKYVFIEHENNLSTLYAHLSRFAVQKGQSVKRGDLLGYSGNTGYSYGPHIHFTVYWSPSIQLKTILPAAGLVPLGVTMNPFDYLPKI